MDRASDIAENGYKDMFCISSAASMPHRIPLRGGLCLVAQEDFGPLSRMISIIDIPLNASYQNSYNQSELDPTNFTSCRHS